MPSVHPPRSYTDYFGADYEPPTPRWRAARRAELPGASRPRQRNLRHLPRPATLH